LKPLLVAPLLVLSLLAAPIAAEAQQAGKVPRVGVLVVAASPMARDSFPRGLRDLGYVEGRDVIIEWRDAEGNNHRVPALAADLVRLGVDVIFALGPEARTAAMKATSTVPIVALGADPVGEGWAPTLARPGGNVTGLRHDPRANREAVATDQGDRAPTFPARHTSRATGSTAP
jgi:putative tryptophan/tyrosine transport system substrate-binding protein